MPPCTVLPPNLNRHLYEARRLAAESNGQELPPWWRVGAEERAVIEADLDTFRRAIRASEEEQDLLGSYSASGASAAAAAEPSTAEIPQSPTAGCTCPGCRTVATITEAVRKAFEASGATVAAPRPEALDPLSFSVVPLDARLWGVPLSDEEKARLEAAANNALGGTLFMTASIDPAILEGRAPRGPRAYLVETAPPAMDDRTRQEALDAVLRWFDEVTAQEDRPEPPTVRMDPFTGPFRLGGELTLDIEGFRYDPRLLGFPKGV